MIKSLYLENPELYEEFCKYTAEKRYIYAHGLCIPICNEDSTKTKEKMFEEFIK